MTQQAGEIAEPWWRAMNATRSVRKARGRAIEDVGSVPIWQVATTDEIPSAEGVQGWVAANGETTER
jgi:hypothetical protein